MGKPNWPRFVCSAWILAHDPSAKIMVITYGKDLSETISRSIRNILQSYWSSKSYLLLALPKAMPNQLILRPRPAASCTRPLLTAPYRFRRQLHYCRRPTQHRRCRVPGPIGEHDRKISLDGRTTPRQPEEGPHHGHRPSCSRTRSLCGSFGRRRLETSCAADRCATDQTYRTAYGWWHRRKGELLRPDADDIEDIERLRRKLE